MPRKAASDPILEKLRKICRALPGAEEYTSFGHPGWRVGEKGFAYYEVYKGELCIVFKAELPGAAGAREEPAVLRRAVHGQTRLDEPALRDEAGLEGDRGSPGREPSARGDGDPEIARQQAT